MGEGKNLLVNVNNRCSFKCILKVGVAESIVNAPPIADHEFGG
jgi:hypothetical protein